MELIVKTTAHTFSIHVEKPKFQPCDRCGGKHILLAVLRSAAPYPPEKVCWRCFRDAIRTEASRPKLTRVK